MKTSLKEKLVACRQDIEVAIETLLPSATTRPSELHTAMRYSMEAGGKRIRPALLIAASKLFDTKIDPMAAAVAIECLHTYTLIHDDLPFIDNSDLRRGRPSCHTQFNEATALLAGDALLTFAFQLLSRKYATQPTIACTLINDLANASGSECLIGGQMEDIENEGKSVNADILKFIHENKTGALLTAALTMGLRFCEPNRRQIELIRMAGYHIGLTFQIVDDILDVTSNAKEMGKPVSNDTKTDKSTYVALYGIEGAKTEAKQHNAKAVDALEKLGGNNAFLLELVRELEYRIN